MTPSRGLALLGSTRWAWLACVIAAWGCQDTEKRPRGVILISIDTLRADHLGLYGYGRDTTPALDGLGERSTVFDEAMSASPWTLPSHATLLTGLYPRRHGLTSHEHRLASGQQTLAQLLSRAGYRTAAVVNSHNLGPEFGLDRGFQTYRYVEEDVARREPSTEITDEAIRWLGSAATGDAPFFLFVHYYDVHSDYASRSSYEEKFVGPYDGLADGSTAQLMAYREGAVDLGAADARTLIDRYDAGIRQMDDELERLLAFLRENGSLEETLLVVTSDHGEEFFEHGGVLHGQTQYQEVLHVPLIVSGPGIPRNRRIGSPVSLVDLLPTLLDLTGVPMPDGLDGVSLRPLWSEGETLPARYLFSEADHNNVEHDITRCVRYDNYKLLYNRLSRDYHLYDLALDPDEQTDLSSEQQSMARDLSQRLDRFLAGGQTEAPVRTLSDEEIEKLRSLGYLR